MDIKKDFEYKKQSREIKKFAVTNAIPKCVTQPPDMNEEYHKKYLSHLGFIIDEKMTIKNPGFFVFKATPLGWHRKIMQSNILWIYLYDKYNRKRAAIYYKFISGAKGAKTVSTFINWMPRYRVKIDHTKSFDIYSKSNELYYNSPLVGEVLDSETKVLYSTKPITIESKTKEERSSEEKLIRDKLFFECNNILKEKFPKHDNIYAYW